MHEMWEESYRAYRHLEHIPLEELEARFRDITANFTVPSPDGKLGCQTFESPNGKFWLVRLTEILEEFRLRGGVPTWILDGAELMPRLYEGPHPGWKAVEGRPLPRGGLMKYGKLAHLRAVLERGEILIRHAAWYADDPSLTPAMRDDELNLDLSFWPGDFPENDPRRAAGANIAARLSAGTDYYAWCVSTVYEPRLYDDFKADACLVLRDPKAGLRILEDIAAQLPGGSSRWYRGFGAAQYIDPLNSAKLFLEPDPEHSVSAFFAKHFRFAYQQEARFIWVPKEHHQPGTLKDALVKIGALADYCELIELPESYEKRLASAIWIPPARQPRFDDTAGTGIDGFTAGEDVDRLVFEHLMRPPPPRLAWPDRPAEKVLPFSTDYPSATRVVLRLTSYGWSFRQDLDRALQRRGGVRVEFRHDDGRLEKAEASTYALAVCRAALKAAVAHGLWSGPSPDTEPVADMRGTKES